MRAGGGGRAFGGERFEGVASRPRVAVDDGRRRAVCVRGVAQAIGASSAQPCLAQARLDAASGCQSDRDGASVLRHDLPDRARDAHAGKGPVAAQARSVRRQLLDRAHAGPGAGNDERPVLMMDFLAELWRFMRVRKKFWLLPILIMMVVFGGLVVLTKGTVFAPFIYTLF